MKTVPARKAPIDAVRYTARPPETGRRPTCIGQGSMEESHHRHGQEKNGKRLLDGIDADVKLGGDGREG